MILLLVLAAMILMAVVAVQIGKVNELFASLRGEEKVELQQNRRTALYMPIFLVLFLFGCVASAVYYAPEMLGWGAKPVASVHGAEIDSLMTTTLIVTGIVFFLTQIALFWFAYKYSYKPGRKAAYISHDNRLEVIWTAIPAVVMTFLVVGGLSVWNSAMSDVPEDAVVGQDYIEIEATGMQFAWLLRHPGKDNILGKRDYKLINEANNQLGIDWTNKAGHDDILPSDIVLPVNKKVRVRITARDVLHNFYLPDFRVKMDAIPGIPTYFVFTPTVTTKEMRKILSEKPNWQVPYDPTDPESKMRWEEFNYELACAELCGTGHWSMRKKVEIVTQEEYDAWVDAQQAHYISQIKGTESDTYLSKAKEDDNKQLGEEAIPTDNSLSEVK